VEIGGAGCSASPGCRPVPTTSGCSRVGSPGAGSRRRFRTSGGVLHPADDGGGGVAGEVGHNEYGPAGGFDCLTFLLGDLIESKVSSFDVEVGLGG